MDASVTQVDLPQISVQRYVELLKRRRWQVIPVSLLGLVVGGIVAFFIPRYFVASATLVYEQPPGETSTQSNDDPFEAIVDSAKLTIPNAIGPTIKLLSWPEGLAADPFELSENIAAIEDRLVVGVEKTGKDQSYVRIRVTYRDRDGLRAARFTNALVETWRNQRIEEQRLAAKLQLATATEQRRQQEVAFDKFNNEKRNLEIEHQIDPSLDPTLQRADSDARLARVRKLRDDLTAKLSAGKKLEVTLANQENQLRDTLPRVAPDATLVEKQKAASDEAKALVEWIALGTVSMSPFLPGTPQRTRWERYVAKWKLQLEEELKKAPGGMAVGEDGLVANPEYAALAKGIEATGLALQELRAEIGPMQAQADAEAGRITGLAEGYVQYAKKVLASDETKKKFEAASAEVEIATQVLGRLDNTPPVRIETPAYPPPRPTEPNIVLVALLGCVVGLLVATALILLLDLLQGSFKTVDDVERSLPVPVLGGISHLQTAEERQALRKGRRRITLLAAAFVFLTTSVVLLFYYDPTRLPPFVRDLLAQMLGAS